MTATDPNHIPAHTRWIGRLFGAVAMLAMLAVVVLGRLLSGSISLLGTIADALLLAMPISVFSWLLDLLGTQAKTLLLAGLVVLLVLIGAWIGGRFIVDSLREPGRAGARASIVSLVLFLCSIGFILLFVNAQTPGVLTNGGFLRTSITLGIAAIVFGIVLAGLTTLYLVEERPDRRRFLVWGGTAIAGLFGLVTVGQEIGRVATRKTNVTGTGGKLSSTITPNDDFYIVSKNFVDPQNDRGPDWTISITGLVDHELTFSRADLEAMEGAGTFTSTQLCISNPVGGDLIGTAEWTGIPLSALLDQAGVGEGAYKVIFEGTDGYTTGVPVDRVMRAASHLVWGMNGAPLPHEHGAPVRAIIPGLYGMKSAKWLTKMTLTKDDYKGYWETRNWTDEATVKTMSRIDTPSDHDVLPAGPVDIGGIAFAGDERISAVEVSTDNGATWQKAEIRENPAPGSVEWVIWTFRWQATSGAHVLVVRAVLADGSVQTDQKASELPDGASGWHRITVGIA
ncbi:MAG TPA: molybdopterin-dependent oxidoreductase [Thermomicrobiales bacterium]|nr:molybdopterin-dependent oxidoreductase [Thermomicrobiales bacterium]